MIFFFHLSSSLSFPCVLLSARVSRFPGLHSLQPVHALAHLCSLVTSVTLGGSSPGAPDLDLPDPVLLLATPTLSSVAKSPTLLQTMLCAVFQSIVLCFLPRHSA